MIKEEFTKLVSESNTDAISDDDLLSYATEVMLKNRDKLPRLYRYSSADYYNIRGLETQTLYLRPAGNMNDVFEGLSCEINDEVLRRVDTISDLAYLVSLLIPYRYPMKSILNIITGSIAGLPLSKQ